MKPCWRTLSRVDAWALPIRDVPATVSIPVSRERRCIMIFLSDDKDWGALRRVLSGTGRVVV